MAKRIITISREYGSGGRFIGEEVARKLALHIMTRISLDRLQNSQDCHQSTLKKMQSYLQRKVYLHMPLPDVTLQESP